MRLAAAAVLVLAAARPALACETSVIDLPQALVHESALVAEGVATADPLTFELTRFWKGSAGSTVLLTGLAAGARCNDPAPVRDGRYLVLVRPGEMKQDGAVTVLSGKARILTPESARGVLAYLAAPRAVSGKEVARMLQRWHDGQVTDAKVAAWVREITPVADPNDWQVYSESGDETSIVLGVLRDLDRRMNEMQVPLEELACPLNAYRTHVAPAIIPLLTRRLTAEEITRLDEELDPDETIERLCPDM